MYEEFKRGWGKWEDGLGDREDLTEELVER